jgi:hypothetical protein
MCEDVAVSQLLSVLFHLCEGYLYWSPCNEGDVVGGQEPFFDARGTNLCGKLMLTLKVEGSLTEAMVRYFVLRGKRDQLDSMHSGGKEGVIVKKKCTV